MLGASPHMQLGMQDTLSTRMHACMLSWSLASACASQQLQIVFQTVQMASPVQYLKSEHAWQGRIPDPHIRSSRVISPVSKNGQCQPLQKLCDFMQQLVADALAANPLLSSQEDAMGY